VLIFRIELLRIIGKTTPATQRNLTPTKTFSAKRDGCFVVEEEDEDVLAFIEDPRYAILAFTATDKSDESVRI
jgi:hypothetical protein